ncbi:hypothetical protein IQ272_00520 [Chroococcidiopsidales cyanobacterium LEGE 13417]|nr:hypothetical protein [Chroococcidiopsidales cyanobacterium LEGE 13417]
MLLQSKSDRIYPRRNAIAFKELFIAILDCVRNMCRGAQLCAPTDRAK